MRSASELAPIRASLSSPLSWPFLQSLRAEADDANGSPFIRSIFTLGWKADIPAGRVRPLLQELADAGAVAAKAVGAVSYSIEVL